MTGHKQQAALYPALLDSRQSTGRRLGRYRCSLLLALAAPGIAELLSSSAPPLEFFVPWIFALFVLFYGGSAILIREFTLRWNCGWRCTLLLGAASGILQEGIATRAFFDPAWQSLGPMKGIGYSLGVNWVWMFDAIYYHAVFSTAVPILLIHQISPDYRRVRWLGRGGLTLVTILFMFGAAVFVDSGKNRYPASPLSIAFCWLAILVLCLIARTLRASPQGHASPPQSRVFPFGVLGFSVAFGLVLQIYAVPLIAPSAILLAALLGLLVVIPCWLLLAWSGSRLTYVQRNALLVGSLGCFALLGFFQELNSSRTIDTRGSAIVSLSTLIGLYFLWKKNSAAAVIQPYCEPGEILWPATAAAATQKDVAPQAGITHTSPVWRLFEILVSAFALIVSSPIMLLLTVLIRLGTHGKALFIQNRIGRNGKTFRFVKFRTLYVDARQRFPELYAYRYTESELRRLQFKVASDPRVTPQGRWMRTTTLDELPNFWNVLRGDMALVGPRPEIPEMLPYYKDDMLLKFAVRPGVTGLAQISGRGRLGFYETAALDVEYVKNRSLFLDTKIIALTMYKMITRDGAF